MNLSGYGGALTKFEVHESAVSLSMPETLKKSLTNK
jgi:hypothetical protein